MAAPVGPAGPTPKPAANAGSSVAPIPAGTVWSTALLALLKAPATAANYQFLNQWAIREHGTDTTLFANNPFFTTAGGAGTVGPIKSGTFPLIPDSAFGPGRSNTAGVPAYPNLSTGVWITAYHLATEYPAIVSALRTGNPASASGNSDFQGQLTKWSGGGYSGFASISAPAGPTGPTIEAPVSPTSVPSSSGSGGLWGDVTSAAGTVAHGANTAAEYVIPGLKTGEGVVGDVSSVGSFLSRLTDPSYILRGLQIVAGGGLVAVGLVLLARQVALANDLPDPVKAVPGVAAAAAV